MEKASVSRREKETNREAICYVSHVMDGCTTWCRQNRNSADSANPDAQHKLCGWNLATNETISSTVSAVFDENGPTGRVPPDQSQSIPKSPLTLLEPKPKSRTIDRAKIPRLHHSSANLGILPPEKNHLRIIYQISLSRPRVTRCCPTAPGAAACCACRAWERSILSLAR